MFRGCVCWPVLSPDTAWNGGLGQGADIFRMYGELMEMAQFLVKLTGEDGDVGGPMRKA